MTDVLEQEKQILENFVCDKELKELEKKFDKFNIFDCLRLTRTEIRHSNFLAWLLDPNETHGLYDYFLKEFIKEILLNNKKELEAINGKDIKIKKSKASDETIIENYHIPSLFDIDCCDMSNAEIYREYKNIDLLIIDETNKFIFVIENKVDTCQHDNQLTKYRALVDEQYPNEEYKKLYIYLKPQKEDVENPYIYISYSLIKEVLDEIIRDKKGQISDEIIISIEHYKHIIERDFMQKDEISEICKKLYKRHKKAIDLIMGYNCITNEIVEKIQEIYANDITLLEKDGMFTINSFSNMENLQCGNSKYGANLVLLQAEKNKNDFCFCINVVPAKNGMSETRKEIINTIEDRLKIKLNNSDKNNDWCWHNVPIITEDKYYELETAEKLKEYLKQKIDEIGFIPKLQEILGK